MKKLTNFLNLCILVLGTAVFFEMVVITASTLDGTEESIGTGLAFTNDNFIQLERLNVASNTDISDDESSTETAHLTDIQNDSSYDADDDTINDTNIEAVEKVTETPETVKIPSSPADAPVLDKKNFKINTSISFADMASPDIAIGHLNSDDAIIIPGSEGARTTIASNTEETENSAKEISRIISSTTVEVKEENTSSDKIETTSSEKTKDVKSAENKSSSTVATTLSASPVPETETPDGLEAAEEAAAEDKMNVTDTAKKAETNKAKSNTRGVEKAGNLIIAHKVEKGENLSFIARLYDVPLNKILVDNSLSLDSIIRVGQTINIQPKNGVVYTTKSGDSLWKLASHFNTNIDRIKKDNNLTVDAIQIGQKLFIPVGAEYYTNRRNAARKAYQWPVNGRISSRFGYRIHPISKKRAFHNGIDISVASGTRVVAASGGTVSYAGWLGGYGRIVEIKHAKGFATRYAHCSKLLVRNGQKIRAGQTIAKSGSSGSSTGPHLHFEIIKSGQRVNPMKYL